MEPIVKKIPVSGYERVYSCEEPEVGLRGIIAVHSTVLGPACGGIRLREYSDWNEALTDVLRLSKGMSYKSSLAGVGFGGGKSVIIKDQKQKHSDLFRAFGECIEALGGQYIGAQDMNVSGQDLLAVKEKTGHVIGIEGESGSGGDPSPLTARGGLRAFEATVEYWNGTKDLNGLKVAIQGVGNVGFCLAQLLRERGAELWVSDIDQRAVQMAVTELQAHAVDYETIFSVGCDVFSPNATGGILNATTIGKLRCKAVLGCANNQLAEEQDGARLQERGILYVPDFAANAGGIINVFTEFEGNYDVERARVRTDKIYGTVKEVLNRARDESRAPFEVANTLAEERLQRGA